MTASVKYLKFKTMMFWKSGIHVSIWYEQKKKHINVYIFYLYVGMCIYVHTCVHICMHVHFSYWIGLSHTWTWSLWMPGDIISAMQDHSMETEEVTVCFHSRISVTALQHLKFTLGFCHTIHNRKSKPISCFRAQHSSIQGWDRTSSSCYNTKVNTAKEEPLIMQLV